MNLKVVIRGQNLGSYEFLLKDRHEVKEILWCRVTNVVHLVWWYWQTVFAVCLLWSMLHYSNYSLYDVIDESEITLAVAIVEYLDGLALTKLIRKAKVSHIGTAGWTIDRKETKTCRRNVVQFRISMCHQFIGFLCGSIE